MNHLGIWTMNSAGPVVEKSIRREIFYENVFTIITLVLSVLTGMTYMVPNNNDKDFFLGQVVIEKFFPKFEKLLSFSHKMSSLVVSIVLIAPFHMLIYYCGHARMQFQMFLRCLRNLNYGYDELDLLKSNYNEEYQKEITRRLKFSIDRHVRIYS